MNSALRAVLIGTVVAFASVLSAGSAFAQPFNQGPPTGAIIDLNGQSIDHDSGSPATASADFVASVTNTDITLAFREDPAFVFVSDISLTDVTNPSGNLLLDPNFALGTLGTSADPDWAYANIYGATFGGVVSNSCGSTFTTCWDDGAVQAYDAIDQPVALNVGDTYLLSFQYWDNSGLSTFSQFSTDGDITDTGGNGADILAYAQSGLPPPPPSAIPEPGTLVSLGTGLLSLAGIARRRLAGNAA